MAGGGGGAHSRELDQTPTWAVASVCGIIILISILLEKGLHHLGEWFTERRKKAMFEALEKIKAELMILGFISLLLTFGQSYIVKVCIPQEYANTMLPCSIAHKEIKPKGSGEHHRRLLWDALGNIYPVHRQLSGASTASKCHEGKVPLISLNGLHQLHIFIFFLAVFHVASSAITMALGRAKIRGWKEWEIETSSPDSEFSNDSSRFRFSHETSFVRMHISLWNKVPVSFYFLSFFRQFVRSVRKADYLTMRHGFVTAHLAVGTKFDFQKYIKRTLEDDFKVVVGISPTLWASAVIFLLLNVNGWHALFWISVIPLIGMETTSLLKQEEGYVHKHLPSLPPVMLAVGTKLQAIITKMALEIKERHAVIQGIPLVQLSDQHFWFGRPRLVLFLIHFTLFQNAFQIIYFLWILYEFGLDSCFNESRKLVIIRICLGIGVQFLISYITLPLYALVSQMGTHMKKSIFDEQTSKALTKWRNEALKKKNAGPTSPNKSPPGGSPKASVPRFKSKGSLTHTPSRRRPSMDQDTRESTPEVQLSAVTSAAAPADLLTGTTNEPHVHVVDLQNSNKEDEYTFIKLTDA